jgi:ribosomal-protein-alanine N-acetyltransferase
VLRLRDYTSADFPAIWSLDQICFPADIAYSKQEMRNYLAQKGAFAIVAEEAGNIAGFMIAHKSREVGYVITIDVHPDHRKRRAGTLLMHAAEQRLRDEGAVLIHLEVAVDNAAAIRFYERHGYRIVRRIAGYYQGSLDAYKMVKRIAEIARDRK